MITATISFAVGVNILLYGLIGPLAVAMIETFGIRPGPVSDAAIY